MKQAKAAREMPVVFYLIAKGVDVEGVPYQNWYEKGFGVRVKRGGLDTPSDFGEHPEDKIFKITGSF